MDSIAIAPLMCSISAIAAIKLVEDGLACYRIVDLSGKFWILELVGQLLDDLRLQAPTEQRATLDLVLARFSHGLAGQALGAKVFDHPRSIVFAISHGYGGASDLDFATFAERSDLKLKLCGRLKLFDGRGNVLDLDDFELRAVHGTLCVQRLYEHSSIADQPPVDTSFCGVAVVDVCATNSHRLPFPAEF